MRNILESLMSRAEASPHKIVGFALGVAVPLVIVLLFWAQTSGGLAGPLVDTRPPAFIVATD